MQLGWKFFSGKLSSSRQIRARQITGQKLQPLQNSRAPHKEIAEAFVTIMQRADIGEKDKTLFPSRHLFPSKALIFRRLLARPRDRCCGSQLCIAFSSATFIPSSSPPFGRRGGNPFRKQATFFLRKKKRGRPSITPFLFPASALSPILLICRAKKNRKRQEPVSSMRETNGGVTAS